MANRWKRYGAKSLPAVMVVMASMRRKIEASKAKEVQPVRNWSTFAVQNGQVVYRGRYFFTWSRGHFVGAYDTLDDAVEALEFRNKIELGVRR